MSRKGKVGSVLFMHLVNILCLGDLASLSGAHIRMDALVKCAITVGLKKGVILKFNECMDGLYQL